MLIVACIVGWLACAVATAGISFAYVKGRILGMAEEYYREQLCYAWVFGIVLGPIGLVVAIIDSGFCKYGWRLK